MSSKLVIQMVGKTTPPTPYTGQNSSSTTTSKTVGDGNQDDEIEAVYAADVSVPASGTVTINLATVEDLYGDFLAPDDIAAIIIKNNGLGDVEVKPGAANGWTGWLGTGSALKIPAGCTEGTDGGPKGAYPITPPNVNLDITETGGADSAELEVQFWVRRTP